jgi:TonB family protein
MSRVYILMPLILCVLSCKEIVQHPSPLPEETADNTGAAAEQATHCCDAVVIERDTTAVDVKNADMAPEILAAAKPVYSMEMIENEVAGTVKLKLRVGTDGRVKEYIILNDLGHGANKAIHTALTKMQFTPARKNKEKISVWIETTIHFILPKIEY